MKRFAQVPTNAYLGWSQFWYPSLEGELNLDIDDSKQMQSLPYHLAAPFLQPITLWTGLRENSASKDYILPCQGLTIDAEPDWSLNGNRIYRFLLEQNDDQHRGEAMAKTIWISNVSRLDATWEFYQMNSLMNRLYNNQGGRMQQFVMKVGV